MASAFHSTITTDTSTSQRCLISYMRIKGLSLSLAGFSRHGCIIISQARSALRSFTGKEKSIYYTEAETRDLTRTDVIVDYLGQQYVVELKIWRGESYNERGEQQLAEYLDYYHLETGYLVSFCFNKNKQPGLREVKVGDRTICEAIV